MSFCLLPLGCELDSAITLSTRMLILCNPSNPTGSVYSAEQLEALAEVKRTVLACHATWLQRHAAWLPRHGTWLQRGCRGMEHGCSSSSHSLGCNSACGESERSHNSRRPCAVVHSDAVVRCIVHATHGVCVCVVWRRFFESIRTSSFCRMRFTRRSRVYR